MIQTYVPDNPVIEQAACQDYEGFFREEILGPGVMLYPPFCSICAIGFSVTDGIAGHWSSKTVFKGSEADCGGKISRPAFEGAGPHREYDCENKRKIPL